MEQWFVIIKSFGDWNIIHKSLGKKSALSFLANYDNRFNREIRVLTSLEFSQEQQAIIKKKYDQSQAKI